MHRLTLSKDLLPLVVNHKRKAQSSCNFGSPQGLEMTSFSVCVREPGPLYVRLMYDTAHGIVRVNSERAAKARQHSLRT